jgi:hypothetical protein
MIIVVGMRFELKVLCMQSKHSTACASPPWANLLPHRHRAYSYRTISYGKSEPKIQIPRKLTLICFQNWLGLEGNKAKMYHPGREDLCFYGCKGKVILLLEGQYSSPFL